MKDPIGIGRRKMSKNPKSYESGNAKVWDPNRSMTEQLKAEKDKLFGKGTKVYPLHRGKIPRGIDPVAVAPALVVEQPSTEGYLTVEDVAGRLECTVWTVRNAPVMDGLQKICVNRRLYYTAESVEKLKSTDWYARRQNLPASTRLNKRRQTPEEYSEARREYARQWRKKNADKIKDYQKLYYGLKEQ